MGLASCHGIPQDPVVGVADWIRTSMFSFCRRDPIRSRHCDSVWGVVSDSNRCFLASQARALSAMLTTPLFGYRSRSRTYNHLSQSQTLCQLSYPAFVWHATEDSNPVASVLETSPLLSCVTYRLVEQVRFELTSTCVSGKPLDLLSTALLFGAPRGSRTLTPFGISF
jgi:hypothetical protein